MAVLLAVLLVVGKVDYLAKSLDEKTVLTKVEMMALEKVVWKVVMMAFSME